MFHGCYDTDLDKVIDGLSAALQKEGSGSVLRIEGDSSYAGSSFGMLSRDGMDMIDIAGYVNGKIKEKEKELAAGPGQDMQ